MRKISLFIALIATISITFLVAQRNTISFDKRWEKVRELATKQLPESALKEVDAILLQAQKEKNAVETIKATVYKMRFTLEKDPDKAPALIRDFETFTEKATDPAECALLHSMTAELYSQYYQKDSWIINNRTEVKGHIPDDIKEWTKNIFFDKISKHLIASLQNPAILQKTDVMRFGKLLLKGDDSRIMQPTLFDLLANRRIDILQKIDQTTAVKNPLKEQFYYADAAQFILQTPDTAYQKSIENPIIETYQQLLRWRLKIPNTAALLNLDLERLQYIHSNNESASSDSLYLAALTRLQQQYAINDNVVEVLAEKASYYFDKVNQEISDDDQRLGVDVQRQSFKRIAYNICEDGIKRFPHYKRIGLLYNIQKKITAKNIEITHKETVKPSANLKVEIQTRNLSNLQLNVYKVNVTALQYRTYKLNDRNENKFYPNKTLIETRSIKVKSDENFGFVKTAIDIKATDYGIYEFSFEENGNKIANQRTKGVFTVTDFAFMARSTKQKSQTMYVLDRQSGQSLSDVLVKIYSQKWNGQGYNNELLNQVKSTQNGSIDYSYDMNYYNNTLFFEKGNDKYFTSNSSPHFYDRSDTETENVNVKINLFTDRSLYRLGQTVYFKGIAYLSTKNLQKVSDHSPFEVILFDANNQKISSKKLETNDLGSFASEFVLPQGGLSGAYRLQVGEFSENIWVEEYKRPTFEVEIKRPTTETQFGDKVIVKGTVKAFAGFNIADASIKYRVVRRTHHYCWWWSEPEIEVTNGLTKSKSDGSFEVAFLAERKNIGISRYSDRAYSYTVYANVTDPKGETQQGEQTVSVGDKSLFIIADIPAQINKKKKLSLDIITETINEEKVDSNVKYILSRLEDSDLYAEDLTENENIKDKEQVLSGVFDTKNKKLDLDFQSLKSGRYKIVLSTFDAHKNEVKIEKIFILYDLDDKRPPVKSYVWLQTPKVNCAVDEIAKIQFGTSTKNTAVLYELMQGNKVLESRWIPFSDELKTFEIPYEDSYGAGVTVLFTFMKDERFFTKSVQITRKVVERKLTPSLSVFRNKLLPGEKAEWTITVPESAKDNKATELLVSMYDASLDNLRSHDWYFNPTYRYWITPSPNWNANAFTQGADNVFYESKMNDVKAFSFDELNWFGLDLNGYYRRGRRMFRNSVKFSAPVIKKDEEVREEDELKSQEEISNGKGIISIATIVGKDNKNGVDNVDLKEVVTKSATEALQGKVAGLAIQTKPEVKVRTNFNETAFFYPQLRTDSSGNVKFSFTAPESLTRWNVKMLAHTKDLYFGQGEAQVITQKDLMVQMNLPRFVRRSDKLVLNANVINLTDKEQNAEVTFEMIDPATEKVIFKESKQVLLAPSSGAGGLKAVEWELNEFSPYELVTCKVVARAGNFSDGEQKYLPVFPDKVLVTESMPLTIRSNQTRTFNFESLLKNGSKVDSKNLTVEFSSNPAWYAVQALPTISAPESENALDYFTAYYANILAGFIANSNPKLAAMFDRWKKAGSSREALLSNLEKNTELKNMLLEETPWVMAAQNETEQKRQIALLFDLNMQKNQAKQYLDKLISLQLPSGGFTWYKGMTESRYITQEIVLNLGRLNRLTKNDSLSSCLLPLTSAIKYLDLEIARDFEDLKKQNKNYEKEMSIDNMQLFYLHLRSEYPQIPVEASAQAAVKFYTAQSEKYWKELMLYGKAMMAVVANRNGKTQLANDILKSLKENALKTDELGMYWARNTSGYFWNERPIAIQSAIIEAFADIAKNTADVDELKIWLLKQKQTQRWDSPTTTVDAIYALLYQGSDWLSNSGTVKISLGNIPLQPTSVEAGTGYFKETIPVAGIHPEMGKITVSTTSSSKNTSIGWGAMYWQYYQDLTKVESQGGALKLSKKLFVEQVTATGKTLFPIEQNTLKKGDKVITRLVVTTDRNLEFVALKDLRASCLEPVDQLSGCVWKEGVCYYQTTKDASTQFFFSYLPKGTYVFEYETWVNAAGEYSSGIASIQCQYAPEFISHTGGEKIVVK